MGKRLTADQRGRIAEKIMEWGNLMFIALVAAQIIPGIIVNMSAVMIGVTTFIGAYIFATFFMKGGKK